MKQRKRATVMGQRTAGAMLTGEFFKLTDGFSVVIPTADYYTQDGYKIDRQGVAPSIEVKPEEALNYTMDQLIRK